MPDQKQTLEYHAGAVQVLTGNAWRAARTMGGVSAVGMIVIAIAMWTFAREPFAIKVDVVVMLFCLAGIGTAVVSLLASLTVARVHNGRLNFSFCGVRTRSIPLDSTTTFQMRLVGRRMRVLVITSGGRSYVPNGALDRDALMELLRMNGVAERPWLNQ